MDSGIQQRGEPHRTRDTRSITHDLAQGFMTDTAHFDLSGCINVMVEPLQGKAVQIDEIARHVNAGDEALFVGFDRPENVSFDQDHAAIGLFAPAQQTRAIPVLLYGFDQLFDVSQIIETKVRPKSTGQEIAGMRKTASLDQSNLSVHGSR